MYDFDNDPMKEQKNEENARQDAAEERMEQPMAAEGEEGALAEREQDAQQRAQDVPYAAQEPAAEQTDAQEQPKYAEPENGPSVREYRYEEQVKKVPKVKKGWAKFIAACLIVSIAGGASIGIGYGFTQNYLRAQNGGTASPAIVAAGTSYAQQSYSASEIIKAVKPSVVSVSTKTTGVAQYFGSFGIPYEASGAGSGVVFYSDAERVAIATNNHVIEGANSVYVTFEGDVSVPAKVIGADSDADLAVLTVAWSDLKENGIEHVTTAVFGDSDALEVGDSVIAIGNAMGLGIAATDGIISMTEQTISVDGKTLSVLQTSAAINSGNSGGALVNSAGEVIGINTAKYNSTMAEGMGYAIPSNTITSIVEGLLETGTAPKPYIGIVGTSITEETAPAYNLPVGALVMEITEGGPAEQAGLEVGDVITQYNGKAVTDMNVLVEMVGQSEIGKTMSIHVVRDGNVQKDLQITIADKNS